MVQTFFSDWGALKHGVPQGSVLGPLLFKIYVSDLPLKINSESEPVLFTDDTSVIISSSNFKYFCSLSNLVSLI
jgi:C4-dicarboxylate-specific signal transduction histidine kinase